MRGIKVSVRWTINFTLPNSILIVEDNNIISLSVQSKLIRFGYEVLIPVSTGEQAVEMAIDKKPDLILMDIHLSGKIDGIEAAKRILKFLDIPIVFITAYTDKLITHRVKEILAYSFMAKPFTEKELLTNIEMALYKHKRKRRGEKK